MTRSPKRMMQYPVDDADEPSTDAPMPRIESLERLQARLAELERHNAQLDRFAATVAHELRAPLIAADGYLTLLEEDLGAALHGRAREDFDRVRRETRRIRMLTETLLEQARSRAESLSRRPVAVDRLVAEAVASLDAEIAAHGAEVSVGPLPTVSGDPRMLAIVIANLLSNALRYGLRDGGVIRLAGRHLGDRARIEVENDGATIDATERARIFEPFTRSRGERRADGLGLGLAICRMIVEQHGGAIGVEPLPRGNRFWLTLPD
jgi:signal transduction histidine kinase